jgi:uncharacterized repeat protein (TIGR01451 family)
LLAGITLGAVLVLVAAAVSASSSGRTAVTLCHATGSQTNPYVLITTDDDGVLGSGRSGGDGHDGHGGDIVPPFGYIDNTGAARSYSGKNWDAAGQAILENGCRPPGQPPPPAPPPSGGPPPPGQQPPGESQPHVRQPLIDVVVSKVDSPDPVPVGATLVYTITVSNRGPDAATDVRLSDPLPRSLALLSVAPSQGTCTVSPMLACELGTIPPGVSATVVVRVRPRQTGRLENAATAVGAEPEANPADNTATAVTVVIGVTRPPKQQPPEVRGAVCIDHRVSPLSIRVGRPTSVRVVVTAAGKPVARVRVVARGAGVSVAARTDRSGVARFLARPTRSGFVRVSLPGRNTCRRARLVGVVAPVLLPPVTG